MHRMKIRSMLTSIFKTVPLFVAIFVVLFSFEGHTYPKCGPLFEAKADARLPLIAMDPRYQGENQGKYRDPISGEPWKVKYYSEAEKKVFQLRLKDGIFHDHQGKKMDSDFDAESLSFESGLFVIDKEQRMFLLPFEERGKFHHSSLTGGQDVIFAGTAAFSNGRLREFTDNSGHYKPSPKQTIRTLKLLRKMGVEFKLLKVSGRVAKELSNSYSISGKELEFWIDSAKLD